MSELDIYTIRSKVAHWFRIRAEFEGAKHMRFILDSPHLTTEQKVRQIFYQLAADVDHSALLIRLLEGKDPLPEPPPLRHAYPDYEAVEGDDH